MYSPSWPYLTPYISHFFINSLQNPIFKSILSPRYLLLSSAIACIFLGLVGNVGYETLAPQQRTWRKTPPYNQRREAEIETACPQRYMSSLVLKCSCMHGTRCESWTDHCLMEVHLYYHDLVAKSHIKNHWAPLKALMFIPSILEGGQRNAFF